MEKINLVELLKDCPEGMELDCTMYEDVCFYKITDNPVVPICLKRIDGAAITLTKYGGYADSPSAKCVIFPKGKTTWEGFQRPFKDGDVVVSSLGNIHILKNRSTSYIYVDFDHNAKGSLCKSLTTCVNAIRLATEEEKAKLFKSIRDNGYKWNAETKTLEKLIQPEFKIGDIIQDIDTYKVKITETNIDDECYGYESIIAKGIGSIPFNEQVNWKLVQDKFDINTLVPFESRVLVRTKHFHDTWTSGFFSHIDSDGFAPFWTTADKNYQQCIPYEGNEHLLGKTDDCDEYFKTWK